MSEAWWIPLTIAAALAQNLRSMLQKRLTGTLSVNGAAYAVGFRGAALALPEGSVIVRAGFTLALALTIQTLVMGLYLALKEAGQMAEVGAAWSPGLWVGLCGAAASAGWFTAMTLQTSALVRTLGQVEVLFALLASHLVFRERIRIRELVGIVVLLLGIYLLL